MNTLLKVISRGIVQENGCVLWPGWKRKGYARCQVNGRTVSVHRLVYERMVGPIPPGYDLHHTCETKHCINFAHLEPLPPADHSKKRSWEYQWSKTHCPAGHEYAGDNLDLSQPGERSCKSCRRIRQKEADRRERERNRAAGRIPNSMKTACPQGHVYSETNTFFRANGNRVCRECNRIRMKAAYLRRCQRGQPP